MEPTIKALAGNTPPLIFRRYFLATRPMFMTASVVPVILGSSWGANVQGSLDWIAFVLAMLAVMLVHSAVNVLNDVYDEDNGTDRLNSERIFPYTGGSRFIQNQVLTRTQMRRWGFILLILAIVVGLLLFAYKGPLVIAFGIGGILAGVLYSMPPVQLSARGIGEIAVGLGFGVLPVTGAAWLQNDAFGWPSFLLSLPVSIWVANILLINGVPDASADAASGKRTLAVRLGIAGTGIVYGVTTIAAALIICAITLALDLSVWTLSLPALILLAGLAVARSLIRSRDPSSIKPLIETTLAIHAIGTLWLALWVWT